MRDELERRSALDSKLLSMARKSPAEIAEATGMKPEEVAERISQLLETRDWLSDRQQERLLLEEIAGLKDMVMDRVKFADEKEFTGVANVALRTLKLISERLDARKKLVVADIDEITSAQARLFGKAFDVALQDIVGNFKALESVPEDEDIDILVSEALKKAVKVLEGNVISE